MLQIGEALASRQGEIGSAVARRIVAEIPEFERAPEDVLADLLEGATATVGLLSQALAGALDREQLAVVRDLAARRVHQDVSLEVFLHAYRVALVAYWDACAEEATRLDLSRDASLELAKVALAAMDLMATHAAEGYLREESRLRVESGRQARDAIERLIRGLPPGAARLPAGPLVTIVGRARDAEDGALEALQERLPRALIALRESELVIVAADAHGLLTALEGRGAFGVSLPAADHTGLQQAYREASLALSYASSEHPIVSLADLSAFECLLVDADATTRAVIAAKGSLPDEEDRQTVRAFAAADLNVSRTAAALRVHPNTIRYRLQRIADATGQDPRTFAGLVELTCIVATEPTG